MCVCVCARARVRVSYAFYETTWCIHRFVYLCVMLCSVIDDFIFSRTSHVILRQPTAYVSCSRMHNALRSFIPYETSHWALYFPVGRTSIHYTLQVFFIQYIKRSMYYSENIQTLHQNHEFSYFHSVPISAILIYINALNRHICIYCDDTDGAKLCRPKLILNVNYIVSSILTHYKQLSQINVTSRYWLMARWALGETYWYKGFFLNI